MYVLRPKLRIPSKGYWEAIEPSLDLALGSLASFCEGGESGRLRAEVEELLGKLMVLSAIKGFHVEVAIMLVQEGADNEVHL